MEMHCGKSLVRVEKHADYLKMLPYVEGVSDHSLVYRTRVLTIDKPRAIIQCHRSTYNTNRLLFRDDLLIAPSSLKPGDDNIIVICIEGARPRSATQLLIIFKSPCKQTSSQSKVSMNTNDFY